MHTLIIPLICMTLTVVGADPSFDLEHRLIHPNRPGLPQTIALKPCWQELQAAEQEQKDNALYKASTADDFMYQYSKKTRKDIAALVYLGAHVPTVQQMQDQIEDGRRLLPDVTLMHDIPLAKILLEHGADVHQKTSDGYTAIYHAQTVALAQVLIAHRALDNLTKEQKAALMHKIMAADYDPELITLYKENGVYLTPNDYNNASPIISLIRIPQNYMNTKARLFLNGYSKAEQLSLLTSPKDIDLDGEIFSDISGCTVFDIIEEQKTNAHEVHVDRLNDLHNCLLKMVGERCSLCPELLNPLDGRSFIKTNCGHIFCLTCLDDREKSCPLCPSKLMYYGKRAAIVVGAAAVVGTIIYLIKSGADTAQQLGESRIENAVLRETSQAFLEASDEVVESFCQIATSNQTQGQTGSIIPVSVTTLSATKQANAVIPINVALRKLGGPRERLKTVLNSKTVPLIQQYLTQPK